MDFIPVGPLAAWKHSPEKKKPKSRVLLIHGLSEHSGRHLNTVNALNQRGIEVVRFDLRGAGRSGGRRQWVESFDNYVQDAAQIHSWIRHRLDPLPLYVLGHSLGGTVAIHFAQRYAGSLAGLMLSAPAHNLGSGIPKLKIAVGKILSIAAPSFRLARGNDQAALSRDPEVVKAFLRDPLCTPFNTLKQGSEILRAFAHAAEPMREINLPTVIFHGSADRVVSLEGSFELLQVSPSRDKTLHVLPGSYHEPHNDIDKENYFQLLTQWLDNRLRTQT
jgi:acylglycerol lipase